MLQSGLWASLHCTEKILSSKKGSGGEERTRQLTPVIAACERWRQENPGFKASPGYTVSFRPGEEFLPHSLHPDALPFPHRASSVTPSLLLLLTREHLHRLHSPPGLTLRHKDLPRAPPPHINCRLYLARQGSEGCNPRYTGNKSRRITSSRPAWALELVQDQHEKLSETISN